MPQLREDVSEILFRHDPIGINFDENPDEYDGEAGRILDGFKRGMTLDQLLTIIHEEFVQSFDRQTAGPREKYAAIAEEIWGVIA